MDEKKINEQIRQLQEALREHDRRREEDEEYRKISDQRKASFEKRFGRSMGDCIDEDY